MKVLLITGSLPPDECGIGDYSYNLAQSLCAYTETEIGVLTRVGAVRERGLERFDVIPLIKTWSVAEVPAVIKFFNVWRPEIVHIQYPCMGYNGGLLPWFLPIVSFLLGKKVVQTWHEGYGLASSLKLLLIAIVPSALVVVRPHYNIHLSPVLRWALNNKKYIFIRNASVFPKITIGEQEKGTLRRKYLKKQKRLILFFGFVYPHKGVDLLFEIADPAVDQILIAGKIMDEGGHHHREIMRRASTSSWLGKSTITGFLPATDIATLLAIADAVVLPFRDDGGGEWNTSIHAAVTQGVFLVTTSITQNGYDSKHNIYRAEVDNVKEMKSALNMYAGTRREVDPDLDRDEWSDIAGKHQSVYKSLLPD